MKLLIGLVLFVAFSPFVVAGVAYGRASHAWRYGLRKCGELIDWLASI